jgi:hypothetical protein
VVLLQINRFSTSAIFIHVSHFFFFLSLSFLNCFSIRLLEALLEILQVVPLQTNRFSTIAIFLFMSAISLFFLSLLFFTLLFHQVPRSTMGDTTGGSSVDQLVNHLSHFFVHLSHFFVIFISVIFYNVSSSIFWKQCW